MRIITNIAGVITDHGAMVTVVMRMFSSVCSSWWPLDTDVWDQYLKMIINSQHPWTLKMFFIIDCSSLYCDVCPGDLSSDCQWLETGEMIGSNVSNVHTVTSIIIIILDILIFSINNFLTTPQRICCKPWLECLKLYQSLVLYTLVLVSILYKSANYLVFTEVSGKSQNCTAKFAEKLHN